LNINQTILAVAAKLGYTAIENWIAFTVLLLGVVLSI
jgi:hypothetical protein